MKNEDRILDVAPGVTTRRAKGRIMDLYALQHLSITELIIIEPGIRWHCSRIDLLVPRPIAGGRRSRTRLGLYWTCEHSTRDENGEQHTGRCAHTLKPHMACSPFEMIAV